MHFFQFNFSYSEIICFGALFLVFLYQMYFYARYLNGAKRYSKRVQKPDTEFVTNQPPVSVIICAKNEEQNLKMFLPLVLSQQYADFEVIVIDDGSDDNTSYYLDSLKLSHPNLHSTFVPKSTKNLSTKKLGVSLGIKAAKNELLLLIDADCRPASDLWIAKMARNFTSRTEIILGYGAYNEEDTLLNRIITFDTLFTALQYLGMAVARKAYMGVGRNLAYRKSTFYENGGFSPMLHLVSGDDDLFVNRAATRTNTRIEISPESITWSEPKHNFRDWMYQKIRHLSVSGNYKAKTKIQLLLEPFTRELFYAAFVVLLVFGIIFGNLLTCGVAILLFVARYFTQFFIINRAARHFGGMRKYVFMLPVADIFVPLFNIFILTVKRPFKKGKNIFWK
ncbi:MAG: glycosyltransferase [Prevotellaceae bacterium]|jgi:glycosyltransferase involved in cell wall biosynthesis|nr:glycosyltransferase [Prevotellaceae bacterium]